MTSAYRKKKAERVKRVRTPNASTMTSRQMLFMAYRMHDLAWYDERDKIMDRLISRVVKETVVA